MRTQTFLHCIRPNGQLTISENSAPLPFPSVRVKAMNLTPLAADGADSAPQTFLYAARPLPGFKTACGRPIHTTRRDGTHDTVIYAHLYAEDGTRLHPGDPTDPRAACALKSLVMDGETVFEVGYDGLLTLTQGRLMSAA